MLTYLRTSRLRRFELFIGRVADVATISLAFALFIVFLIA